VWRSRDRSISRDEYVADVRTWRWLKRAALAAGRSGVDGDARVSRP